MVCRCACVCVCKCLCDSVRVCAHVCFVDMRAHFCVSERVCVDSSPCICVYVYFVHMYFCECVLTWQHACLWRAFVLHVYAHGFVHTTVHSRGFVCISFCMDVHMVCVCTCACV